jgi:cell division protein FtsB
MSRNNIITLILLIIVIILACAKIILFSLYHTHWKHRRDRKVAQHVPDETKEDNKSNKDELVNDA